MKYMDFLILQKNSDNPGKLMGRILLLFSNFLVRQMLCLIAFILFLEFILTPPKVKIVKTHLQQALDYVYMMEPSLGTDAFPAAYD